MTTTQLWDNIVEYGIATEAELQLITSINGYNVDTLTDVLYTRTGERSLNDEDDS